MLLIWRSAAKQVDTVLETISLSSMNRVGYRVRSNGGTWAEADTKKSFISVSAHLSAFDRTLYTRFIRRGNRRENVRKDHRNIGVK